MRFRPRLTAVLACAVAVTCLAACSRGPAGTVIAGNPAAGTGTKPPPLNVLTRDTSPGAGDIFIAPAGGGYPAGPEILAPAPGQHVPRLPAALARSAAEMSPDRAR